MRAHERVNERSAPVRERARAPTRRRLKGVLAGAFGHALRYIGGVCGGPRRGESYRICKCAGSLARAPLGVLTTAFGSHDDSEHVVSERRRVRRLIRRATQTGDFHGIADFSDAPA